MAGRLHRPNRGAQATRAPSLLAAILISLVFAMPCRAASPASSSQAGLARVRPFDDGWRFHRGDAPGADRASFDDSSWRAVDLPHDWSIENLPAGAAARRAGPFDKELSAGKAATGGVVGGTGWYPSASGSRDPARSGAPRCVSMASTWAWTCGSTGGSWARHVVVVGHRGHCGRPGERRPGCGGAGACPAPRPPWQDRGL